MQNKKFLLSGLICYFLLCFILYPIFSFVGGYFLGWVIEAFLSKPIIHALLVFGIAILPEHIPYICATFSLFCQMAKLTLGDIIHCLHGFWRH